MRARKKSILSAGFTHIFTENNPDPSGASPKKKPYIVFKMLNEHEEGDKLGKAYRKALDNSGLASFGLTKVEDNEYIITITSARKVIRAIEIFYSLPACQIWNNDLVSSLDKYKQQCEAIQAEKGPKPIPRKSKIFSNFTPISSSPSVSNSESSPELSNVTCRISRVSSKKNTTIEYIFKENVTGRTISEIEVFNAYCYRALLGKRHAKVKGIHKEGGDRVGVASEVFPNFVNVIDYFLDSKLPLSKQKLLDSEMIKIWVAAYVEEETDLHLENYGFNDTKCVKFDDDRSTWALTAEYADIDPEVGDPEGSYQTPPVSDFIVTQQDISSFPWLQDANPYHWFNKNGLEAVFEPNTIHEFVKEEKCISDKFYVFLKRILIPREVYEAIGLATIGSAKTRDKFVNHKCNKTEELKRVLLNTPEFQAYVIANPHVIQQIKDEFAEYNADYHKPEDAYLHVDLKEVEKNFNQIVEQIVEEIVPEGPVIPPEPFQGAMTYYGQQYPSLLVNQADFPRGEKRKVTAQPETQPLSKIRKLSPEEKKEEKSTVQFNSG